MKEKLVIQIAAEELRPSYVEALEKVEEAAGWAQNEGLLKGTWKMWRAGATAGCIELMKRVGRGLTAEEDALGLPLIVEAPSFEEMKAVFEASLGACPDAAELPPGVGDVARVFFMGGAQIGIRVTLLRLKEQGIGTARGG